MNSPSTPNSSSDSEGSNVTNSYKINVQNGNSKSISSESNSKSKSSKHTKNSPSEVQLLDKEAGECKPPTKQQTLINQMKRKATILPMQFGADAKTPEGFSLQKFIEENQKKMEEKQMMLEGRQYLIFFRN